jgi:RHS repeat-associated protein
MNPNRSLSNFQGAVYQHTYNAKKASGVCLQNVTDYSPFGAALDGRTMQRDGYRYGFNSMEKDDEVKGDGNSYDFGARICDSRVGRFLSVDRFAGKFSYHSPYIFAANMPILASDKNGDSVWVTTRVKMINGIQQITHTIHVEAKILDLTGVTVGGGGCSAPKDGVPPLITMVENNFKEISASTKAGIDSRIIYVFDVNVEKVSSMSQVKSSDHLIVLVDDVTGKADPNLGGGEAGGIAEIIGKIAYVERGDLTWMSKAIVHEIGHNLGLGHQGNGTGNYMSYDKNKTNLTYKQFQDIHGNIEAIGKTINWSKHYETDTNYLWHTSSNEEPYDMDVKKGEKTPKRLY